MTRHWPWCSDVLTAAHTPDQTNWAADVVPSHCLQEVCNVLLKARSLFYLQSKVTLGSDLDLITETKDMDLFNGLITGQPFLPFAHNKEV